MHTKLRALLRSVPALSLCALTLFALAAPPCAAATGPIISGVSNSPNPILAKGGYVTVTAKVTDTTAILSGVTLYETYPNSGQTRRTAPMAVGSDGITYSATVPVELNTNSTANGERLYIVAVDNANNQATSNVATQGFDNTAPSITSVASNPTTIPAKGATVTVTAKVTDIGVGLSSVILYETYPNSGQTRRTAPMAVGSDGITYSATVPVDLNTNSTASGERLYIVAVDNAGNQSSANVATQGFDNAAPTITSVANSPSVIPAKGATVTVTAQVADTGVGLSSVILYETYPNSGQTRRTAPMAVGSDGITYSATVPVDLNTNSTASGENLYIVAVDNANNQVTSNVATQGFDNTAPSIASNSVTFSPDPIPIEGANVTVTAKVTDTGVGLSSVILYETYPNSGQTRRTAPMAVGSDGITYSATVPVDLNSNPGANGESLYFVAVDKANNQVTYNVTTQGYSSVPVTGSMPILITADESKPVLSPAAVPAGSAELTLILNGNNFAAGATVLFNGVTLVPNSVLLKQISVNVPASLLAQPGSFAVSVLNPSPSVVSNSVNLNVLTAEDVTTQVTLNYLGQRYDRASGSYLRSYRLTNTGRRVLPGALSLVTDHLTNARLANAAGITHYKRPVGSPFVQVAAVDLPPGASTTATLALAAIGTGAVTYTPRVLAGIGAR